MISEKQNEQRQIERLSAQRQLYATAKNIFAAQLVLSGPIAVATSLLAIIAPKTQSSVAFWGVLVGFADLVFFSPWQSAIREKAAKVQEVFDCEVLSLPWNSIKAGTEPDSELICEQAKKYQTWAHKMPTVKNWYSTTADQLPPHIARIACQRTNCWWDAEQRRKYARWIIIGAALLFVILFAISFFSGLTIAKFMMNVMAPFLPALILAIQQYKGHVATANRLDDLKEHNEMIWKSAISGESPDNLRIKSRILQDEIFENRKNTPFVFDFIYKRIQPDFENQMNYGMEELVEKWHQKQG